MRSNTRFMAVAAPALLIGVLSTAAVRAADAPPSAKSIEELMTVLDARHMVDTVRDQLDPMMQKVLEEAGQGAAATPDKQAILDRMRKRMVEAQQETFKWDNFGPMMARVYSSTFTQKEVDQMIVFYRSAGGQAVVKKMPLAMQNIMVEMQPLMKPMFDKIRIIQQETMQQLQDTDKPAK